MVLVIHRNRAVNRNQSNLRRKRFRIGDDTLCKTFKKNNHQRIFFVHVHTSTVNTRLVLPKSLVRTHLCL